jgi:hypothetical protein
MKFLTLLTLISLLSLPAYAQLSDEDELFNQVVALNEEMNYPQAIEILTVLIP